MDCYNREDRDFIACASDIELAKKRLDYLVGKRWFIGACFAVLSVVAVALYIVSSIVTDEVDVDGTRFGAILFGVFAFLCVGVGSSIDSQVKALILHVHKKDSQQDAANDADKSAPLS